MLASSFVRFFARRRKKSHLRLTQRVSEDILGISGSLEVAALCFPVILQSLHLDRKSQRRAVKAIVVNLSSHRLNKKQFEGEFERVGQFHISPR